VSISLTFASGTNPDTAQIQVQNKLQEAVPLLPQVVQLQGITVSKSSGNFMMMVAFVSDGRLTSGDIGDFMATQVLDPISRIPGVGHVELFDSKYALRIWVDPDKLKAYGLTPADVSAAVQSQNAQVSVGQLGGAPFVPGQQINATVTALGRMQSPEQFRNIVLRGNGGGSTLRLGDVARVEIGQTDYGFVGRFNGRPASGMGVTLAAGANALSTQRAVSALLDRIRPRLPPGVRAVTAYDETPYVRQSIYEVVKTLAEAIVLVFLVMWLFLQNLRATLIPTITVPVVLLGTFAVLAWTDCSINMLTMFAAVLAIGLLVDDAIVVVENVERLMRDEGLTPADATRRSMDQITGALIGIATVLSAVFVPMAFLRGSTGVIYRQFSITIVSAMVLSVIMAIVLTPALCATLLRPIERRGNHGGPGVWHWFNRMFERAGKRYRNAVAGIVARPARFLCIYAALASLMAILFFRLPTAFLPEEDQGSLIFMVQTPVGATLPRTTKMLDQMEDYFLNSEKRAVDSIYTVAGWSFSGNAQNTGIGFVLLRDWSQRHDRALAVDAIEDRANAEVARLKDATGFVFAPPAVSGLGASSGFDLYLKDDGGRGHTALTAARDQFLEMTANDKLLANVRPTGQEDAPQFRLDLDVEKAMALGLSMNEVNDTLAVAWGGRYIDDFIDRGRVKHVVLQADAPFRMVPDDFKRWYVRNTRGDMVSIASIANSHWEYGSPRLERYNGVAAMEINGEAAAGVSSGDAMKELERLAARLPPGFTLEFTGQSYEERAAGAQTPVLYALSLIVVFLCLAALYESWSIPVAILMAAPLGIIGAVLATAARGLERDVYFQVAMLTTIGLASKNAILIVEFAKKNIEGGMAVIAAILDAVHDRLRPILMTSLAFGLGVLPLALAGGAGAGAQRAIGTGVVGGMVAGTFLGIFFIPLLFLTVQRLFHSVPEK
jgi:multidrug efflux pump